MTSMGSVSSSNYFCFNSCEGTILTLKTLMDMYLMTISHTVKKGKDYRARKIIPQP